MDRENTSTTRHPSMPRIAYRMMSESCVVPWLRGGLVVESDTGSVSVPVVGVSGVQPLVLSQITGGGYEVVVTVTVPVVGRLDSETVVAQEYCVTVRVVGRLDSETVVVQE